MERKEVAILAVQKAGDYLLSVFGKNLSFHEKGYLDLVSEADRRADKILAENIWAAFPDDGILSEETFEFSESKTGYHWIADPLDGTHNFLAGYAEFGTLLALRFNDEVILGVCYFPKLAEFFIAEKNRGAFLNDEKILVSKAKEFRGEMFCSDGIMRERPREILKDIERFCASGCRLRVFGSSPFAFTRVALGRAVVATNRLCKPWDIAAPALLVEEAGGKVTDENGNPWKLDSQCLIATNAILHEKSLALFK